MMYTSIFVFCKQAKIDHYKVSVGIRKLTLLKKKIMIMIVNAFKSCQLHKPYARMHLHACILVLVFKLSLQTIDTQSSCSPI